MHAEPQKEHQWLHKLIGEWAVETQAVMEAGQPPLKFVGTESVRSIGGLWVVCEGRGEMPGGGTATTIMTLGHDPTRKKYVGTFIGSMMTHMWNYEGELDASEKILALNTEGPGFTPEGKPSGVMAPFQDVIEFLNDGHRTLTAKMRRPDGTWNTFLTAHYHRK